MNTFNLIWNYNAQVVNQNNYYDQNACKEPDANTDNEHELPKELQSNRARGMLDRAVERELLKEGYQPHDNVKKWQLALLADAIATELELKTNGRSLAGYGEYPQRV